MTVNSVEEKILAAARYKLNVDEKVSFPINTKFYVLLAGTQVSSRLVSWLGSEQWAWLVLDFCARNMFSKTSLFGIIGSTTE